MNGVQGAKPLFTWGGGRVKKVKSLPRGRGTGRDRAQWAKSKRDVLKVVVKMSDSEV